MTIALVIEYYLSVASLFVGWLLLLKSLKDRFRSGSLSVVGCFVRCLVGFLVVWFYEWWSPLLSSLFLGGCAFDQVTPLSQ